MFCDLTIVTVLLGVLRHSLNEKRRRIPVLVHLPLQ